MTRLEVNECKKVRSREIERRNTTTKGKKVIRKYRRAMIRRAEYIKLKAIIPAVAQRKSVTKLTVIEEAIKYINELHKALSEKLNSSAVDTGLTLGSDPYDAYSFSRQLFLSTFSSFDCPVDDQKSNFAERSELINISSVTSTNTNTSTFQRRLSRQPLVDVQLGSQHF